LSAGEGGDCEALRRGRRLRIVGLQVVFFLLFGLVGLGVVVVMSLPGEGAEESRVLEEVLGLAGAPLSPLAPESLALLEAELGPRPEADETGRVALVCGAFRPGQLGEGAVRFVAWGAAVPFAYRGELYWAVPFRYEAAMGFGTPQPAEATALIRDGYVQRFLFKKFWNFN